MPRHSRISVDLLETFVTLMETEGDAATAMQRLGINQPSMSKRLALLQHRHDAIPYPWITREGKVWKPTDAGKLYLPAATEIVERQRLLENSINLNYPLLSRVSLCCGEEAVRTFVRPAVEEFRKKYPDSQFRVSVLSPYDRIMNVATGAADLATVTHDEESIKRIARRPLHIETLTKDPLALVMGKGRKDMRQRFESLPARNVRIKHLADFPLVLPAPDGGTRVRIDTAIAAAKLRGPINVIAELEGWQTLLEYVQCGIGVGILPRSAIEAHSGPLLVKWLDDDALEPTTTKLICRYKADATENLDLSDEARALRELLIFEAGKLNR
ncbi:MAG: LysR family transcriptional regulator [Planctomycetaceae bacterium]|nr:LysR family transcriptional regulator [Planctomycetaceae bacterium]